MQKLFNAYSIISVVISVGTQTDEEYINQGKCMIHSVSSSTEQNLKYMMSNPLVCVTFTYLL